jgi:hypothetical protein
MNGLLQQIPALVGVIVGVVTTYVLTTAGERARWRRDQRVRWDEARMGAYVEYGNAVKRVVHVASRMAVTRGLPHSSEPVPLADGLAELNEATAARTATWESVLLLGDPDTITAARAWHQCVWELEFFARGRLTGEDEWTTALADFERTRHDYYRAARHDLGVGSGVPTVSWPPPWYARVADQLRQDPPGSNPRAGTDDGTDPN